MTRSLQTYDAHGGKKDKLLQYFDVETWIKDVILKTNALLGR